MIIVTRSSISEEELTQLLARIEEVGVTPHLSRGAHQAVIGCVGDVERLRGMPILTWPGVDAVLPVRKPYKLASREFRVEPSQFGVGPGGKVVVGGPGIAVIGGPCSVEGREMLDATAVAVKASGAVMLRGGAFKPRTSPYGFQGMGEEGLKLLAEVRERHGLPVVTEVMDTRQVELVAQYADVLQVGSRNMHNFPLLTEVGKTDKPVLLKRGFAATIKEFLLAAEYIMAQGNHRVILCIRGIRTYEDAVRNTFDVGVVPVLKHESHLPVFVDPSHAAGIYRYVAPLAFAGIAAGADGMIVEVHPDPPTACSDGEQSLTFASFDAMMAGARRFAEAAGRSLLTPLD